MTMNPEAAHNKDTRKIVWMGEIPVGMENEMRYPTEKEIDEMIYDAGNMTDEELGLLH